MVLISLPACNACWGNNTAFRPPELGDRASPRLYHLFTNDWTPELGDRGIQSCKMFHQLFANDFPNKFFWKDLRGSLPELGDRASPRLYHLFTNDLTPELGDRGIQSCKMFHQLFALTISQINSFGKIYVVRYLSSGIELPPGCITCLLTIWHLSSEIEVSKVVRCFINCLLTISQINSFGKIYVVRYHQNLAPVSFPVDFRQ